MWDNRFLELARLISTWSKDPSTQVGAVIIGDKRQIISQGYNGFPRKIKDDDRLNSRHVKYNFVIHAELNAIYNAGYNGVSTENSTIYVYGLHVCHECAKAVIQSGISRVVMQKTNDSRWDSSAELAFDMFEEAGVEITILGDLNESKI